MADKYASYACLSTDKTEGVDYQITAKPGRNLAILVVAPHGGKIEKGTSEIAKALAGNDFCLYLFEGKMQGQNRELHITSHNFDEPLALKLIAQCSTAISVHGRNDEGDMETIYLGGLDNEFIDFLEQKLNAAGFKTKSDGHDFQGKNTLNICNRGKSKKGAQVEIPKTLRAELMKAENIPIFDRLVAAVRSAMEARVRQ